MVDIIESSLFLALQLDLAADSVPNGALEVLDASEDGLAELESLVHRLTLQFVRVVGVGLVDVRDVHR
jgi:hypothetical protein